MTTQTIHNFLSFYTVQQHTRLYTTFEHFIEHIQKFYKRCTTLQHFFLQTFATKKNYAQLNTTLDNYTIHDKKIQNFTKYLNQKSHTSFQNFISL
jgi:hypothetical protein